MVTEQEIDMLAGLSKLKLTNEEKQRFLAEMSEIVAFADTINENVSATDSASDEEEGIDYLLLREDEERDSYPAEDILSNASSENGFFLVRRNSVK